MQIDRSYGVRYEGLQTGASLIQFSSIGSASVEVATRFLLNRLTRAGKVPLQTALAQLTTWESVLVQLAVGRDDLSLVAAPVVDTIRVTESPLCGISLWRPDERPSGDHETLGWLRLSPSVLDMVEEQVRTTAAREDAEMRAIDSVLSEWQRADEIDRQVAALQDFVERVETVYVLIGREIYSKSDAGSNTLSRDGLLEKLRRTPVESWRRSDRLFVVAAHCLFISGRAVRFEEFNGRQLTATRLREYLLDRYASYCAAVGQEPVALHEPSPIVLARRIRELQAVVDRSPMMRYRRINGFTFVKNEYLADFPFPRDPATMPALVARHGRENLDVVPSEDVRGDLRAMALAAAAEDARCPAEGVGAVGELLAAIVSSAVRATDADYGMSSAVRELGALRGAGPGDPGGVLALKKADFFCCCLPHPHRMDDADDDTVPILWRAAQRMMYNRWHFIPGEFDRADIPANRHYFFPPQVPDIAEHCDRNHGGHKASRVRFTIRAPGAQVWHPPFTVFGHGFRGCYDIRLVRMEGPPFTMSDVMEAVRHCSLVDELWRTLAVGVERGTFAVPPIRGFDRSWYESRGWERLRSYPVVSTVTA